jgi:putative serine protease PepD
MGDIVDGGNVPGRKKVRLPASACAPAWGPVVSRRLAVPGIAVAVLGVAACGGAGIGGPGALAGGVSATGSSAAPPSTVTPSGEASSGAASSLEQQYEQVVSRVLPSVVQISTSQGSGSGVIYDTQDNRQRDTSRRG